MYTVYTKLGVVVLPSFVLTARIDLFTAVPPKIISVEEDRRRGPSEMLNELHTLQEQLTSTYKALGCALGQLSAANAHCTSIHHELGHVHQELENVTQKKQP